MGIRYKVPGSIKGPRGTTYDWHGMIYGDKLPEGWFDTLVEAIDAHLAPKKRKRRTKSEIEASKAETS